MEIKRLLCMLEERLVQHDNNRKDIQRQLQDACTKLLEEVDSFDEKISGEIHESFNKKEEEILGFIEKLNKDDKDIIALNSIIKEALKELSNGQKYEIEHIDEADSFIGSYRLSVSTVEIDFNNDENEGIPTLLRNHLNKIRESAIGAQDELAEICTKRRNGINAMIDRINGRLELLFTQEDTRIQGLVSLTKKNINNDNIEEMKEITIKIKAGLATIQKYTLKELSSDNYDITLNKEITLKYFDFEQRKPLNLITSLTDKGEISISFTIFNDDETKALIPLELPLKVVVSVHGKGVNENAANTYEKGYTIGEKQVYFSVIFSPSTTYCVKMRIEHQDLCTQWSDEDEIVTSEFNASCVWKKCPDDIEEKKKYSVDGNNPRIATKIGRSDFCCTIIGNTHLPPDKVASWNIKILKSVTNNGEFILIGIALFDIDQNRYDTKKCGWYFYCCFSTLISGPPHNYKGKPYGPRLERGKYVRTGDTIGVIMDTSKGELSFVLNGVNYGVAYEGIPLDKPLIPCVILEHPNDSVELSFSEIKENVDSSISVPCNISTKSETCDSIDIMWDAVEGASFYQIEVDESMFWDASITNLFTLKGLSEESEHSFKVRAVKGNSVGEWSDIAKGKTVKASDFSECVWKKSTDKNKERYFINENNPRIATKASDGWDTIIGNTFIPLNKVSLWNIEILKSKKNDGRGIWIGVAPSSVNQNEIGNYRKSGWYFYCLESSLHSGPPHNYNYKSPGRPYGPRKVDGEYVHSGDTVGVVMDTTKGDLSFVLNGINLGVAYEGIPLDKPLVPCVALWNSGDSVELCTNPNESSNQFCIIS